jgi:hypothetical protein
MPLSPCSPGVQCSASSAWTRWPLPKLGPLDVRRSCSCTDRAQLPTCGLGICPATRTTTGLLPTRPDTGAAPLKSLIETADRVAELIDTRAAGGSASRRFVSVGGEVAYVLMATDQAGR